MSDDHRATRRARFRRFMWLAHAITALAHVPFVLGLGVLFSAPQALGIGVLVFVTTTLRLQLLVREDRRPRLLTLLVDEPLLTHWCACVLAFFLLPAAVLAVALLAAIGLEGGESHVVLHGAALSYGFSLLVATWGVWVRRRWLRVVHVDIPIAGLSPELDGYRIAQISDLHIGNYDSKGRGLEWAARVNRLEPDLVAVTGDLVTTGTRFYEDVADVLGALRGKDGVFVSMGNHDQWDPDLLTRLIGERGPRVLRNALHVVRRGAAELAVAGIDDRMTGKDDLTATLDGRRERVPTVLLSHYPDFFEDAADRGVELVLSGHTHGGQIAVPFMARRASLSRLARQHAHGLHVRGVSRLYVNAGIGTTGPPVRLGVPPEIAVLVLRRT
jgi:uncharacterized protein